MRHFGVDNLVLGICEAGKGRGLRTKLQTLEDSDIQASPGFCVFETAEACMISCLAVRLPESQSLGSHASKNVFTRLKH